jgi:hypothetical protein
MSAPAEGRPDIASLEIAIADPPMSDPGIRLKAYPNEHGFIGRIETEVEAASFDEAMTAAYGAVSATLSVWSVHLDTPLEIADMGGKDLASGAMQTSIFVPYPERPFVVSSHGKTSPDFRPYAGFYREALNSNSPPYQFLCLFKILEGVKRRRATIRNAPQRVASNLLRESEIVPANDTECADWLKRIYSVRPAWHPRDFDVLFPTSVRGWKFGRVRLGREG